MALISLYNVTLGFGDPPLLDKVNFNIEDKECICILGRNGMGKSTLLKLLHGDISADDGKVIRQQGLITARLEQDVPDTITGSVYDVIAQGLGTHGKLLADYQRLTHLVTQDNNPALLQQLHHVQHELDKYHAWDLSHKIENVISRLELPGEAEFSELSGGMKRRVLLGQAIVTEPHILLLDEPTNHLDIEAITWLENFIQKFSGTVIFITHDRAFLQKLATRLLEIDRGIVRSYSGNYAQYLEKKQHELDVEETHNQLFDKKLAQEEVWIRQGIKARRTRNEGRVRALEKLREIHRTRRDSMGNVTMQIQQAELSGKLVIEAKNISHRFQDKPLITNFSTTILRGDKIGIIGPNGVGKSTLLKILLKTLTPQQGTIKHGTKIEIAYFDQLRSQLDEEKTVAENVSYGDQFVKINGKSVHIIGYLQDFLFSPERSRSKVKSLSGGERNRLLLARLFSLPANLLVMDEPTNDLDLETLELLEELLINFAGTLLLVSHDRAFLNNVVTSTLVFEGNGIINEYVGGYDDWLRQRQSTQSTDEIIPTKPSSLPVNQPKRDLKQQKELKAIEQKIEKLEIRHESLQTQLGDQQLYNPGQEKNLAKLQNELAQVKTELDTLLQQWEDLMS